MEARETKPNYTFPEAQSGQFEIAALLNAAFGDIQLPRPAQQAKFDGAQVQQRDGVAQDALGDESVRPADHVRDSLLGTTIYMPVSLGDMDLDYATIQIDGNKVVGMTPISGGERRGTVKEEFSLGDYKLRIRGILLNNDNQAVYPQQLMRQLREILETPGSIALISHMAELFNINRIAVTRFRFPDLPGTPAAQPFEINGVSDDSLETELLNL